MRITCRRRRGGQWTRVGLSAGAVALLLAIVPFAFGCGGGSTSSTSSTTAGAIQKGGALRVATYPADGQYDPALFGGNSSDIQLQAQALEKLVTLGSDMSVEPTLATKWESSDSVVWKFTLRDGVTFTNGDPFTSADVVYSMERLMSKKLGSSMASVYSNIKSVTADDASHVTFTLKAPDSEFPASLADYHTLMLDKSVKDAMKNMVGTGPFMLQSFTAGSRAVLVRNPHYWGRDAQGNQLPYLDQVEFIFTPSGAGQFQGLQGGTVDLMMSLSSTQKQQLAGSPSAQAVEGPSNICYELQIRCDQGPATDVKFRQALLYGTDQKEIVGLVAPGVSAPGNGTLVGPAYAADYLDSSVPYDPAKAKQLLQEAGYGNGVSIKLVAYASDPLPAIATVWQAQMKKIGVNVSIQQVPQDVFYSDKGTETWYQADFSLVDWGVRATPLPYFQLALTSDAPWNYSRWKDPEFDSVVSQIPQTLDQGQRTQLYHQAQQILQQQVPMINMLVDNTLAGVSSKLEGVALAPDGVETVFSTAYFKQ